MSPFTPKDWRDDPDHTTPITAAALEDLETRVTAYTGLGAWFAFSLSAFNTPVHNTTGSPVWISTRAGVISDPQENGHIYLQISADGATGWIPVGGYFGVRNNSGVPSGGEIGVGGLLTALIPTDYWWQLATTTIGGWNTPTFILESTTSYAFAIFS